MFWIFGLEACGTLGPWPGIEPTPPSLDGEVITTGPPGKRLAVGLSPCGNRTREDQSKADVKTASPSAQWPPPPWPWPPAFGLHVYLECAQALTWSVGTHSFLSSSCCPLLPPEEPGLCLVRTQLLRVIELVMAAQICPLATCLWECTLSLHRSQQEDVWGLGRAVQPLTICVQTS